MRKLAFALLATTAMVGTGFAADKVTTVTTSTTVTAPTTSAQTITEVTATNPDFSTLNKALMAAGLDETLRGAGPYTVFAPTNAAFDKLGKGKVDDLLKPGNKDKLTELLTYHVAPQNVPLSIATANPPATLKTVEGENVTITKASNNDIKVNNAKITRADIMTKNGVIHVIDTVLMPGSLPNTMHLDPSLNKMSAPEAKPSPPNPAAATAGPVPHSDVR